MDPIEHLWDVGERFIHAQDPALMNISDRQRYCGGMAQHFSRDLTSRGIDAT